MIIVGGTILAESPNGARLARKYHDRTKGPLIPRSYPLAFMDGYDAG